MLLNAGVFNSLTCKCASHHSGVEFFDIKPPKSSPYPSFFPHFDLQICFAPQRRAIFEHRNVQKSGIVVFSTFWLTNVLRATAAWHFGTSELPKWLRDRGVLCILTCKCASRHSGVAFFEHRNFQNGSANVVFCAFWLANVLFATAACHFSPVRGTTTSAPAALASPLFEHQGPRFIEKTQRFATSLTFFAHVELLASDSTRMLIFLLVTWLMLIFLLLTWLLCDSAFQLYILSEVRLLNFLRWFVMIYCDLLWFIMICILLSFHPGFVMICHRRSSFYPRMFLAYCCKILQPVARRAATGFTWFHV